jgi:hypothetical protein
MKKGPNLVALDRLVERAELLAEHARHLGTVVEQIERGKQVARQRAGPVVSLALHRPARRRQWSYIPR